VLVADGLQVQRDCTEHVPVRAVQLRDLVHGDVRASCHRIFDVVRLYFGTLLFSPPSAFPSMLANVHALK